MNKKLCHVGWFFSKKQSFDALHFNKRNKRSQNKFLNTYLRHLLQKITWKYVHEQKHLSVQSLDDLILNAHHWS